MALGADGEAGHMLSSNRWCAGDLAHPSSPFTERPDTGELGTPDLEPHQKPPQRGELLEAGLGSPRGCSGVADRR
jgi:hypothetical protein